MNGPDLLVDNDRLTARANFSLIDKRRIIFGGSPVLVNVGFGARGGFWFSDAFSTCRREALTFKTSLWEGAIKLSFVRDSCLGAGDTGNSSILLRAALAARISSCRGTVIVEGLG